MYQIYSVSSKSDSRENKSAEIKENCDLQDELTSKNSSSDSSSESDSDGTEKNYCNNIFGAQLLIIAIFSDVIYVT